MSGWSTGLLECMSDQPAAIDSLCCPTCQVGYQSAALDGAPGSLAIMPCLISSLGGAQCCICLLRRNMSERYQLDEGCIVSVCTAYLCPVCSLCQTHRELKARGVAPGGICVSIMGAVPGSAGMLPSPGAVTTLRQGDEVKSRNGRFRVIHQTDGNVVVYDGARALWATNTDGQQTESFEMQGDGNVVLYAPGRRPLWATNTDGNNGAKCLMQDDGNLVVYTAAGGPLWATNTVTA